MFYPITTYNIFLYFKQAKSYTIKFFYFKSIFPIFVKSLSHKGQLLGLCTLNYVQLVVYTVQTGSAATSDICDIYNSVISYWYIYIISEGLDLFLIYCIPTYTIMHLYAVYIYLKYLYKLRIIIFFVDSTLNKYFQCVHLRYQRVFENVTSVQKQ